MTNGLRLTIGLSLLALVGVTLYEIVPTATNQGYAPEQPIPFSHRLHAGDNKITCMYCHADVERSRHASVPPVATCMNCHLVVKTDSPWIQQVKKAYDENKPIQWVRIHELPDFVYFPHKRHVAKGLACQTCHGPIETMDKVYQYSKLTMGWCMECHRGRSTPDSVKALLEKEMKEGAERPMENGHPLVAPVQCSTCHY